jgi:hypothetical protein
MPTWTLPAELNQPLPRAVKPRSVFTILLASQVFFFVAFSLFLGATAGMSFYRMQVLKDRGVMAEGTITNLTTSDGGKGRTNYNVTYAYPLVPKTAYTATDQTGALRFGQLHVGDAIPIAYDPIYPTRSLLNFDDMVFTRDNVRSLMNQVAIFGIVFVFTLVAPAIIVVSYRRQKRLLQWGKPVAATIVSDIEYNAGKAGRKAKVSYTFTDEQGRTIEGKRTGLPTKNSREGATYQEMFGDPTVLYDPSDSSKNMLYPFAWIDCLPKPMDSVFSN